MAGRHRSFMAVFYPESAPDNFRDLIDSWHVKALLVLHDQDKDIKAHYHLLLMFTSMKTLTQVHSLTDSLGSKMVEPVYDTRASARYLRHLDHPDKYQYPLGALEEFSGASAGELSVPEHDPFPEILDYVRDQGLVSYSSLVDYCRDHREDWLRSVSSRTVFWLGYLKSAEWEGRHRG
jgi:hypothetical protein